MKLLLNLLLLLSTLSAFSQTTAFEKNATLGRGINLGNMFEAPTETAWGNPFKDEYIERIANLGFNHIRVPICWETDNRSLTEPPYTIQPAFLARIKHVVDLALQHHLQVIINMHHHDELMNDPDGQKARFVSMWKQITQYFSGYSDSLLFELLNEPHGDLTAEKWNNLLTEGIQAIRESDSTRFILVGVAEYGGLGGLSQLQLPADDRLILTIHYYSPFSFTHQGAGWVDNSDQWLGTKWLDTESERQTVQSEFSAAIQYSKDHNIPIHIGEFGAYSKADLESRTRWTTYLGRYFESQGFSWAYWEFSSGFGIYNPTTKNYVQELVDALLHTPLPDPMPVIRKEIIKTGFDSGSSTEGWHLYNKAGASSAGNVSNGEYTINIQNGGTEGWHVQLALNNILLENGKEYEIQIRAKANQNHPISIYAGMNYDPWSSYSGYSGFTVTPDYSLFTASFQMQSNTDTQARLVIDMGNSTGAVSFDEIGLYEVSIATNVPKLKLVSKNFYPNPAHDFIYFKNEKANTAISIYNLSGQLILKEILQDDQKIDLSSLPSGQYYVMWTSNHMLQKEKLIKV